MALEKMPEGSSHPYLYKGDGNLLFKDVSDDWGTGNMKGYFNGAAYADAQTITDALYDVRKNNLMDSFSPKPTHLNINKCLEKHTELNRIAKKKAEEKIKNSSEAPPTMEIV